MNGIAISTPKLAHKYLLDIWPERLDFREIVLVLFLDHNHYVIGSEVVFSGGLSGCSIDNYVLFSRALHFGARAILIAHNHPSGNVSPSATDKDNAKKVKVAGRVLNIDVAQMIVTRSDFYVLGFFD